MTLVNTGLLMPPPAMPTPVPTTPTPVRPADRLAGLVTERGFVLCRETPGREVPPRRLVPVRPPREVRPRLGLAPPICEASVGSIRPRGLFPKGLLPRGLLPKGFTMGLERSIAETVVVTAPVREVMPVPAMAKEEGVMPAMVREARPREVIKSLVLREVTPVEVVLNPVAREGRDQGVSARAPGAATSQGSAIKKLFEKNCEIFLSYCLVCLK